MARFGIICEYNPLHGGHAYHLQCAKDAGADGIVCIMSGNLTQRAEPAMAHKYARAEAALSCGAAVIAACGEVMGYRPSWGMLTGVRPSKVATELLQSGMSKTRVKRTLSSEYFVIPKKAAFDRGC